MISLLVIVVALLCTDLFVLLSGRAARSWPFGLAVVALLIALAGPFAGIVRVPLPSQFLLLWLLIIPIAVVGAVACTLIGLLGQAERSLTGTLRGWRSALLVLPVCAILVAASAELVLPVRLFRAPLQGVETSTGTVVGNTRYGATFVGSVSGALAGTFNASANYRPAFPGPGVKHTIVGGSWSLAIYTDGRFQGTLFGPLGNGTVQWNADVTEAAVSAALPVTGGMGHYLGRRGTAQFTGNLLHLTFPPTVAGSLTLRLR